MLLPPATDAQEAAPADRNAVNTRAHPGDMMADSPVTFPKEGPLPAKYPADLRTQDEPAEKDYYITGSPCRSLAQITEIQAAMPKGRFTPPPPDWRPLRHTRQLLTEGGELRLLALGDSIVNDTMRSAWVAKLAEAYPKARIQTTVYVRGGGGCQHYKEMNRIATYVLPRRPDLVFIGGISQQDLGSIREVIHQLRVGLPQVEILLASGTFGTTDPRDPEALAKAPHSGTGAYGRGLKRLAAEEHCAYLDMTGPWAEYIRSTGLHPHLFYRDVVHANEFGEQILSKILMAFWTAPEPASTSEPGNAAPPPRTDGPQAAEQLRVRLDPGTSHQVIDGFGASDAWQCQFVGKDWPIEKRERMADLLFSQEADAQGNPKGIGLSLWRFNIGAGTAEQGDASDIRNPWRRAECFQNPDGTWDWSKQAGQQWFLRAARRRGVERFLAFPNSPPVQLARNGKGYAAKGLPYLNLKPGKFEAYADFLVTVLRHFQQEGLPFDYLSPFNEPQWAWDEAGQEGTPAQNVELYALIRYLSAELARQALTAKLVIGEAGTIGHAFQHMEYLGLDSEGREAQAQFFFRPDSPFYVGNLPNVAPILSAHDYHSVWPPDKQVEYRRALRAAFHDANPQLGYWMSEYCILEDNDEIGGGNRRDLGMGTALFVARLLHHDLVLTDARSWQWWTAVSEVDYKDGLVYLDDGTAGDSGRMGARTQSLLRDGAVRESKLLWVFGNYSRFVRPGMVRVDCRVDPEQSAVNGVLASAYKGPGDRLVAVLVNLSAGARSCDFGRADPVDVYSTSATENLRRSRQNRSAITLPPRSVTTCVWADAGGKS